MLTLLKATAVATAWPNVFPVETEGWVGSVGNHRYEVKVDDTAVGSALVRLPWRRRDGSGYNDTEIFVVSAKDHTQSTHCTVLSDNNAINSSIAFSTNTGPGIYYVYYLPFTTCGFAGGSCTSRGTVSYIKRTQCAKSPWWSGVLPEVDGVEYQSRSVFHSFSDYERVVSPDEADGFRQRCGGAESLILVAEPRHNQITLQTIPAPWLARSCDELKELTQTTQPGERFTFQVAALNTDAKNVSIEKVTFSQLTGPGVITETAWFSMSTEGVDYWGRDLVMHPVVTPSEVLPLWMGVRIPTDAEVGTYKGNVTITDSTGTSQCVSVSLVVSGPVLQNNGDDDYWRGTRLPWLDSTLGFDPTPPPPFTPLAVTSVGPDGVSVRMLRKFVSIGRNGLPTGASVSNNAQQSGAAFYSQNASVLASDMRFVVTDKTKGERQYDYTFTSTSTTDMTSTWSSVSTNNELEVTASVDATGYLDFVVRFNQSSEGDVSFDLVIPFDAKNSIFCVGLGKNGGFLNETLSGMEWKWDGRNGNNGAWLGSTAAGGRVFLKGDEDLWQAAVPYDGKNSPPIPQSWSNGGQGGITVLPNATIVASTGYRRMKANDSLTFRFSFLLTPTRPLNLSKHYDSRYAQLSGPEDYSQMAKDGATVINIHQGNQINPWINYPYLTNDVMNETSSEVHSHGMKFKVYNTMRELSNHAMELNAMRSFKETFVYSGEAPTNAGASWLQEHLYNEYEVAWASPLKTPNPIDGYLPNSIEQDAAVKVKALSRWNNYYVQGLRQITRDYSCDGIYLDEIAYDRITMMRAKKALNPDSLIDHHANRGGMAISPAMNYMELYPFIDSLWYGEGFKYDEATPDYWLAEISGIPYGLNSDMLRYSGMTPFPYRGMLHASANRWQCGFGEAVGSCPFDPRDIWSLWKSFDIKSAMMFGWWLVHEDPLFALPVTPSSPDLKVTSYVRKGLSTMIVIASFTNTTSNCTLSINWDTVGLLPSNSELVSPSLKPMQPTAGSYSPTSAIPIKANSGLILILQKK